MLRFDSLASIENKDMTVAEYCRWWFKSKESKSATTLDSYRIQFERHILPTLGQVPLRDLSQDQVKDYLNSQLLEGRIDKRGKTLSEKSVLMQYQLLNNALKDAVKLRLTKDNIMDLIQISYDKKLSANNAYNIGEISRLLQSATNSEMEIPIKMALCLGLRRGEVLALQWSDLDFENNLVHITKNLVSTSKGIIVGIPKGKNQRFITAPNKLTQELKAHTNKSGLVCGKKNGQHYAPTYFSNKYKVFLQISGLIPMRFHDLRKYHASLLHDMGVPPKIIAERLGHKSAMVSIDDYVQINQSLEYEAAQIIERALL